MVAQSMTSEQHRLLERKPEGGGRNCRQPSVSPCKGPTSGRFSKSPSLRSRPPSPAWMSILLPPPRPLPIGETLIITTLQFEVSP